MLKIKFKTDYSPRIKGEVVELENKLAEYYLSIGVAEIPCTDCPDSEPCVGCNELIEDTKKEVKVKKGEAVSK